MEHRDNQHVCICNWSGPIQGSYCLNRQLLFYLVVKDTYWSTQFQPGNIFGPFRNEPYSRLQAAVSTFSTGPVAPSDGIGFSDAQLILRSCTSGGLLLQVGVVSCMRVLVCTTTLAAGPASHGHRRVLCAAGIQYGRAAGSGGAASVIASLIWCLIFDCCRCGPL